MKGTQKESTIEVTRTNLFQGKQVDPPIVTKEKINVRIFATDTAIIGYHKGITVNMGDFNSVKVDVIVHVPCYIEEVNEVYSQVVKLVDDKIDEHYDELERQQSGEDAE